MGEKDGVDIGAAAAGGQEALGGARAAIDEVGGAVMADDLRGAEAARIDLRQPVPRRVKSMAPRYPERRGKTNMAIVEF